MGDQVEQSRYGGPAAHGEHHVAELGHRAVGQPLLQVHLREGDGCAQETGDRADHSDHGLNDRELAVERVETGHQEHPGGDHRCGVNQRGNRGGALHRIRQPHVKGELGRLGHGAEEHQQAEQECGPRCNGA